MPFFFIFFFSSYSLMHVYAFLKARAALGFGYMAGIPLGIFMAAMTFAPLIVRLSEKHGFEALARSAAYTGYIWMGLLFLFFSISIALDAWRLLISAWGLALKQDLSGILLSKRASFVTPLIFSLVIIVYGYYEASNIRAEFVSIETAKLPAKIERLRIAQITDVHLGLIVRNERLSSILHEINKADPDILVSTGDLVDGQINNLAGLADMLREINPRYGKVAVTGNHEFYAGLEQALDFTEKAGFVLLRGETADIAGIISIAGVDDPAGKPEQLSIEKPERELLSALPADKFILLLKHRPVVDKDAAGLFDLQLSGHTHKGQIFPFSIATWLYYPVHAGKLNIRDSSYLYVSRGAGTWGPPIRFMAPPEVTIIDLIRKE